MNSKDLCKYITTQMSAEKALQILLESSLLEYEKLKSDEKDKEVHPVIIISMAAMDLGWDFALEPDKENIEGLIVGTKEYIKRRL
ncbi:MAG TPA: hypothetical protein ENH82_04275 [bacterium]|nr:hypothetical protein [bacterium]